MKTTIKATGTTLTLSMREWIDTKLTGPILRLVGKRSETMVLKIDFGKSTKHHKQGDIWFAEANLSFGKSRIVVEASADNPRTAIDNLARELKEDIKKFSEKKTVVARRRERTLKSRIKRDLK